MPRYQFRGRWLAIIGVAGVLAGCGVWLINGFLVASTVQRGWAAYSHGDWEDAAELARGRLRVKGDDADALRLLARASVRLGRDSSAMGVYGKLGSEAMTAEDLCLLGIALNRSGNPRALEVWEQARAAEPDHAETLFELTRAYSKNDRLADAAATGRKLAECAGWESRALALLGSIELARNDPDGALVFWRRAREREASEKGGRSGTPSVPPEEFARALLQTRQPAEAKHELERIIAREPGPETFWLLSRAYLQEGLDSEALAAWKQSGSFRADNPVAQEPSPLAGAKRCAECHPTIFQAQQSSRHAHTFFRASELANVALPSSPVRDPGQAKVLHSLKRVGPDVIEQQTQVEKQVYSAIVEYALGSGDRGLTFVGRGENGRALELRLSRYRDRAGYQWDVTSGHFVQPRENAQYLGEPLTEDAVRQCLGCHVTSSQAVVSGSGPAAADHGIACERCHGPGENHILAVKADFPDRAIVDPRMISGSRTVALCAQCHSPRRGSVSRDDPSAVRFQGTSLTWSRCFLESEDQLDCITCHDPHRDAVKSSAHYESKCLSCHSGLRTESELSGSSEMPAPSVCRVNPTNGCIGCHMPSVKDVVPHSSFTDHFIRVHRD
jgi:tetratricopeptide (TPR) repeat protein